jgi:hypothetical protein
LQLLSNHDPLDLVEVHLVPPPVIELGRPYAAMDSFRDNWWGSRWGDGDWRVERYRTNGAKSSALGHAEFLSTSQRKDAQDENAHLNSLPVAGVWLGQRAIAYVKAHPEDNDAAEALALTVRVTHLSCSSGGSKEDGESAVSKQAFEMLHRMYPKSPWAAKTPYYY